MKNKVCLCQVHVVFGKQRRSFNDIHTAVDSIWFRFILERLAIVVAKALFTGE